MKYLLAERTKQLGFGGRVEDFGSYVRAYSMEQKLSTAHPLLQGVADELF